jgi:hypothetical protein
MPTDVYVGTFPIALAPNQEKEIAMGHPVEVGGAVFTGECWTVFVCPFGYTGNSSISLVGTTVRDAPPGNDPAAYPVPRLFYRVRNNTGQTAMFLRTSVRIRP